MRLLFINQYYPPDTAATGQLLKDIVDVCITAGHEVHVICSQGAYSGGKLAEDENKSDNLTVHRIKASSFGRTKLLGRLTDYCSFSMQAKKLIKTLGPIDAALALTTPPFIAASIQHLTAKKILWNMDLYPEIAEALGFIKKNNPLYGLLMRKASKTYSNMDHVICLGECMKDKLSIHNIPEDKLRIIQNWVPAETVSASPADQTLKVIQYSGNIGLSHSVDQLISAFGQLNPPEWELHIIGKGANRAKLEATAAELNTPSIKFKDPVPLENLNESLSRATLHYISQKEETLGCVVPSKLYGCMASGRAILFCGPEESQVAKTIKAADCGFVISPENTEALENCLQKIVNDPSDLIEKGRNGAAYYQQELNKSQAVSQFINLIEGV